MNVEPGAQVASFELVTPVGKGGMGRVWRARDTRLGREVALKFLHDHVLESRSALARFEQEARSASSLCHPNIVTVHEIGNVAGVPYIVMEFVEGPRLRDLIQSRRLTLREIVRISTAIADALACAHERGITHRDLKPENIMLTADGRPKVLDFGLAKLTPPDTQPDGEATAQLPERHTAAGAVMGTPAYMSPEQASGFHLDYRSDQFSFGAILYEMLTGRAPFQRATGVETMAAIIRDDAEAVSQLNPAVPPDLERIVVRCLQKDPDERYASTVDLLHDIRSVDIGNTTPRGTAASTQRLNRVRARHLGAIAGGAVFVVAAIVLGSMYFSDRPAAPAASAERRGFPARMQLAVLPFTDVKGDEADARFARGLSESIASRLSRLHDIQVIGPSATAAEGNQGDFRVLSRNLGANVVLQSNVLRSGDRVRVTFSFIDPNTGVHLASDSVDGPGSDLFAVEDVVVDAVTRALNMRRNASTRSEETLRTPAAQDRYFQAMGYLQRYDDEASVDRAIELLTALRKDASESALIAAALGRAYLVKYNLTRDRQWADRAEVVCRDASTRDPALFDVRLTMGELYMRTGRLDDAVSSFRRALTLQKNSPEATLGLAEALDRSGRRAEAQRVYREAIALRPAYWAGYNKLGVSMVRAGDLADAAKMFRKAVELAPENVRALYNLGGTLALMGHFDEAITHLERSIAIRPNSGAYSNLGTSYYLLGRFPEAVSAFEKATELTPADSTVWYNLGDAYRWSNAGAERAGAAYATAIRLASEELSVDPRNATLYQTLAAAQAKRGDLVAARTSLAAAERLDPADGNTHYYGAIIENIAGSRDAAIGRLRRAAEAGYGRAFIARDPEFAAFRADERFQAVIRTTNTKGGIK